MITILVATDYSPIAENAVAYAAALANRFEAELIMFNAFTLPIHVTNTYLSGDSIQQIFDENKNALKKRADSIAEAYKIKVEYNSSYSFVDSELEVLMAKYDPDLIVLGMSTRTLEQDLMGNTTTAAIRKMKIPVLAVPEGARFEGMKKVLFACDLLEGLPVKVLAGIKKLATVLKSEVEVFYVDQRIAEMKSNGTGLIGIDIIADGLDGVTYSHKNVMSNAVIREIEKELKAFDAELLIMVPKKYGFWASMVHKSKTRMMASGLEIPLLSIPL